MTNVRFSTRGFEIEAEIDDGNDLGFRWWRSSINEGFFHRSIYVVVLHPALTTGHFICADELGRLILRTPHELFPTFPDCAEHGAADHAAAAIRRHAVQPALI